MKLVYLKSDPREPTGEDENHSIVVRRAQRDVNEICLRDVDVSFPRIVRRATEAESALQLRLGQLTDHVTVAVWYPRGRSVRNDDVHILGGRWKGGKLE